MDRLTTAQRSALMARITGNRLRPESSVRSTLRRRLRGTGMTCRGNDRRLPGTPDITVPALRLAVFVDGCYWHGCPTHYRPPKTNKKFWRDKIMANKERDRRVTRALVRMGWTVARIWEHAC